MAVWLHLTSRYLVPFIDIFASMSLSKNCAAAVCSREVVNVANINMHCALSKEYRAYRDCESAGDINALEIGPDKTLAPELLKAIVRNLRSMYPHMSEKELKAPRSEGGAAAYQIKQAVVSSLLSLLKSDRAGNVNRSSAGKFMYFLFRPVFNIINRCRPVF